MKWLGLLLIYVCCSSWAYAEVAKTIKWSRLGIQFEAAADLYQREQQKLLLASTDIAENLSNIQNETLPAALRAEISTKKLILIFEKNSATDAMFFPPKTKRESPSEEWIITLNPALLGTSDYLRIIAHEFFHAAHHTVNPNEVTWVREGLAQLFEYRLYGGFNFAHIHAGLTQSNFPLEDDFNVNGYQAEKYGNTLLYFYYLSTHCDQNDQLFWTLVQSGDSGRNGISRALQTMGSNEKGCQNFATSAEGFSLAKIMNSYSGFEQSPHTFIHASAQRLQIDLANENKLLVNSSAFWNNLKPYQPQRFSLINAQELAKTAPANVKWWGLEKNYPNRIKSLQSSELSQLTKSWDVGFFLID